MNTLQTMTCRVYDTGQDLPEIVRYRHLRAQATENNPLLQESDYNYRRNKFFKSNEFCI